MNFLSRHITVSDELIRRHQERSSSEGMGISAGCREADMNKSIFKYILNIFFLLNFLLPNQSTAQTKHLKKGNSNYQQNNYNQALLHYNKYVKPNPSRLNDVLRIKMADAHSKTNQFDSAASYLKPIVEIDKDPEIRYKYASYLKLAGEFDKAKQQFDELIGRRNDSARAQSIACEDAITILQADSIARISTVEFNTMFSEFCPVIFGDQLIFTAGYQTLSKYGNLSVSDYVTLYQTTLNDEKGWSKPKIYNREVYSAYHEGPIAIDKSQSRIFVTQSQLKSTFFGKRLKSDLRNNARLKISYATISNEGEIQELKDLPFVHPNYSFAHPSISDNNVLYFSSDQPGGYGGFDLWKSTFKNNSWTKPINLGPSVNTVKDELFPSILENGQLIFSSDGHNGLGGLDFFIVFQDSSNVYSRRTNLGIPFNSVRDDFGITWNTNRNSGYFSSNRENGKGNDDIYGFTLLDSINMDTSLLNRIQLKENISQDNPALVQSNSVVDSTKSRDEPIASEVIREKDKVYFTGKVRDKITKVGIPQVEIAVDCENNALDRSFFTDDKGEFEYSDAYSPSTCVVQGIKDGYISDFIEYSFEKK